MCGWRDGCVTTVNCDDVLRGICCGPTGLVLFSSVPDLERFLRSSALQLPSFIIIAADCCIVLVLHLVLASGNFCEDVDQAGFAQLMFNNREYFETSMWQVESSSNYTNTSGANGGGGAGVNSTGEGANATANSG